MVDRQRRFPKRNQRKVQQARGGQVVGKNLEGPLEVFERIAVEDHVERSRQRADRIRRRRGQELEMPVRFPRAFQRLVGHVDPRHACIGKPRGEYVGPVPVGAAPVDDRKRMLFEERDIDGRQRSHHPLHEMPCLVGPSVIEPLTAEVLVPPIDRVDANGWIHSDAAWHMISVLGRSNA